MVPILQAAKAPPAPGLPLLIVVEGIHDIHFLRSISAMLHRHDADLPDLAQLETEQLVIFMPVGGGCPLEWTLRFAALGKREFHVYDRELEPYTLERRQAVAAINERPGCKARLTAKRSLENYIHADAIVEAGGVELAFGDDDDVPGLLAQRTRACNAVVPWEELPHRSQRCMRSQAKRWLNRKAVEHMTPGRLAEQDRYGEVTGWLTTIQSMIVAGSSIVKLGK